MTKLIDLERSWVCDSSGLSIKREQHLSDDFLDTLKQERNNSSETREGEFMKVASIPTVVVEKWISEGFNILDGSKTPSEIVKRLKAENLDAFITTEKSV